MEAARKHAQRGNFDPTDLLSVLEFVKHRLDLASSQEHPVLPGGVRHSALRENGNEIRRQLGEAVQNARPVTLRRRVK